MFDVGFSELLIIAVVALLVLGPERLPGAARMAGAFVRRARAQWESVRAELERELETERVKADLDAAVGAMQAPVRELEQGLRELGRAATMTGPAPAPGADANVSSSATTTTTTSTASTPEPPHDAEPRA
jgi:sec-independent protein translocase protein TatB